MTSGVGLSLAKQVAKPLAAGLADRAGPSWAWRMRGAGARDRGSVRLEIGLPPDATQPVSTDNGLETLY